MKLNHKWIMVLALVMSMAMATTGTLAYLTDRDSEANVFTMGNVEIDLNEEFEQGSELIPGLDIQKEATITNTGKNDAWVWLTVLLPKEMGPYTAPDNMSASNNVVHWNYPAASADKIIVDFKAEPVKVDTDGDGVEEEYYQTNLLWNEVLPVDETTGVMMSKVYMDTHVDIDPDGNMYWVDNGNVTDLNWNVNDNGNPVIHVSAYAIQAEGFDTVQEAYAAYNAQWGSNGAEYEAPSDGLTDNVPDSNWADVADTSWYNEDDDAFTLTTAEGLAGLAKLVNDGETFKGKTVTLGADVDLAAHQWTPIGNSSNAFQGTFDGGNNTVSNLTVDTESKSNVGLFGYTTNGAIKNLTVDNAKVSGYLNVGVVAGTPYTSEYSNIKVTGLVKVDGYAYVGGVGGKNAYDNWTDITVDVEDGSYVKAESENYRTYVGGVIGFMGEGGHSFTNVTSNIDVYGSTCDVGGITGIAHYGNSFINCSSSGDVTITAATEAGDAEEIGGIAGVWHNGGSDVTFDGCSYTGKLSANITEGVDLSNNTIHGAAYSSTGTGNVIVK